ncbi:AGE family epimerase/isomerase [Aliihoeflea sp. PC F10.4]
MSVVHLSPAYFATDFMPRWYRLARDERHGGVYERLGPDGKPVDANEPKTTLAQARVAFTLAHLYLVTNDTRLLDAAREVYSFLDTHLRDADGGYRFAVNANGTSRDEPTARLRRTYDQSFALLALVTLRKAAPDIVPQSRVDACWSFIESRLTDPRDGSLFEGDAMAARGVQPGDLRGQNPNMHMFEALLQTFEMSEDTVWLDRADALFAIARDKLIDPATGAVREFVAGDLGPAESSDGSRREPGHQFEWAWLLHRYADFHRIEEPRQLAANMIDFVERFGVRKEGTQAGAPFDAVDENGVVVEDTHLLWPLTEAGKFHAALAISQPHTGHAARANRIADLIFTRYFQPASGLPLWVNRLDSGGQVLWPEALSRLVYHVALFVTEGHRAGLWQCGAARHTAHSDFITA